MEVVKASLTTASGATKGYEEYFKFNKVADGKLTFDIKSEATNPTADVPSTLTITVKDSYSHTHHVVTVPMTVLKR